MIPSIFVSSTVEDLHHLRDAVRDTIADLGYTPIMSEYGDVGYLPKTSAQDSCCLSLTDCQLAVLIIGKRYGTISKTGLSVTENEFRSAKDRNIPIITLIDQEVMTFKRVFDAHPLDKKPEHFPGMEAPAKTFGLVQAVMESPTNNAILPFANVAEARAHLKRQLAHLFGELLRNQYNTLTTSVKDVLSEIKTLRHELSGGRPPDSRYLMAIRFLVDESNEQFRKLLEHTVGPVDTAVPIAYEATSLDDFIVRTGFKIQIVELPLEDKKGATFFNIMKERDMTYGAGFPLRFPREGQEMVLGHWATTRKREVWLTQPTLDHFQGTFVGLKRVIEAAQQSPALYRTPTAPLLGK